MKKYILSERASKDIEEIFDYIAVDNPIAAKNVLKSIEKRLLLLAEMPNMGNSHKYARKGVLLWNVKRYVIVYKTKGSSVYVVRVLSTYRDIASLLG